MFGKQIIFRWHHPLAQSNSIDFRSLLFVSSKSTEWRNHDVQAVLWGFFALLEQKPVIFIELPWRGKNTVYFIYFFCIFFIVSSFTPLSADDNVNNNVDNKTTGKNEIWKNVCLLCLENGADRLNKIETISMR